jgi:hypothetical protein
MSEMSGVRFLWQERCPQRLDPSYMSEVILASQSYTRRNVRLFSTLDAL